MPTHLYPHLEKPQLRQMTQPPSCSTGPPHSGQIYLRRRGEAHNCRGVRPWPAAGRRAALPGRGLRLRMLDSVVVSRMKRSTLAKTLAMASGQEVQLMPCWRIVDGQRMPFELVAHFLHADATAQRHAGKAGRCLALAGAAAGPAGVGEHLADAVSS